MGGEIRDIQTGAVKHNQVCVPEVRLEERIQQGLNLFFYKELVAVKKVYRNGGLSQQRG